MKRFLEWLLAQLSPYPGCEYEGRNPHYRCELDTWRETGVGVDIKARKETARLVGVKLT